LPVGAANKPATLANMIKQTLLLTTLLAGTARADDTPPLEIDRSTTLTANTVQLTPELYGNHNGLISGLSGGDVTTVWGVLRGAVGVTSDLELGATIAGDYASSSSPTGMGESNTQLLHYIRVDGGLRVAHSPGLDIAIRVGVGFDTDHFDNTPLIDVSPVIKAKLSDIVWLRFGDSEFSFIETVYGVPLFKGVLMYMPATGGGEDTWTVNIAPGLGFQLSPEVSATVDVPLYFGIHQGDGSNSSYVGSDFYAVQLGAAIAASRQLSVTGGVSVLAPTGSDNGKTIVSGLLGLDVRL
jgi:hypothetical protein